MALPAEAGFQFLSFCDGVVTLSVPRQDLGNWYPKEGWVSPDKERMASALADQYGLTLGEPPDDRGLLPPPFGKSTIHHHLELRDRLDAMIVAHPCYLKVRIFKHASPTGCVRPVAIPIRFLSRLLQDLSALYQP